jgi:hypothetical protein
VLVVEVDVVGAEPSSGPTVDRSPGFVPGAIRRANLVAIT